jgi:hypothetical protein
MELPQGAIPTPPSTASSRSSVLRKSAYSFCQAFLSPPPPRELLSTYFVPSNPQITEHGPSWASSRLPFLGQTFSGVDGCVSYFESLSAVLAVELDGNSFPPIEDFVADEEANRVAVQAQGTFRSKKTGKDWKEKFVYVLSGFDDQGRIGHWEIWADPLSAWEAVGGD